MTLRSKHFVLESPGSWGACLSLSLIPLEPIGEAVTLSGFDMVSGSTKKLRKTNIHVAGVNCKPFSPLGKGEGVASDEMTACASWAALTLKMGHDVVIVEDSGSRETWTTHATPLS
jgi:hypothetical protein